MALTLLYIRFKQLQRELNRLGLYVFILAGIMCYLILVSYEKFKNGHNAYYVIAAMTLLCVGIQASRKDKSFIYKHIENPHLQIFSEYVALTLPFSIVSILTKTWYCFPILLVLLFCIPFLQFTFRQKTIFKNLSLIIPASNFELIGGFRRSYIGFIILYSLAIALCWFRILPLFLLWFLTVNIISFYNECESIQILRESNTTPKKFLLNKLKINITPIVILYTPLLIINSIFNTQFLLLNLLFIPIQISLLCFSICLKYSSYTPNKIKLGNNITLMIVSLCSALPYFLPIPTILSIIYFYKAENNLKQYLND